jgi:hypothetical protein
MTCKRCNDVRWVCERHPDKLQFHDNCPAAGMPCPDCNPMSKDGAGVVDPKDERPPKPQAR